MLFRSERGDRSTYKDFALLVGSERDALFEHMERSGIQCKKYFRPVHTMTYMEKRSVDLPITDDLASRVICIPLWNDMERNTQDYVIASIHEFYGND